MVDRRAWRRALVVLVCALATTACAGAPSRPGDAPPATVVWLVRHAERADAGMGEDPDPQLSTAGRERARELARFLGEVGLTDIHSTPFRRTRQTAAPVSEAQGLEVQGYDPRDPASMESFLAAVRSPGRHLVVGHSNTTPALVLELGGDPGPPIDEAEYDRIYVVVLGADGSVTSQILRFGAESAPH